MTDVAAESVTLQGPVPVHAPDHPANNDPPLPVAVKLTPAPVLNMAVQVCPQLMPDGLLLIVPVPVPELITVNCIVVGAVLPPPLPEPLPEPLPLEPPTLVVWKLELQAVTKLTQANTPSQNKARGKENILWVSRETWMRLFVGTSTSRSEISEPRPYVQESQIFHRNYQAFTNQNKMTLDRANFPGRGPLLHKIAYIPF